MPDMNLVCRDCSTSFSFTEGEQRFYQEKGFSAPVRCGECRLRRKAEKTMSGATGSGNGMPRRREW